MTRRRRTNHGRALRRGGFSPIEPLMAAARCRMDGRRRSSPAPTRLTPSWRRSPQRGLTLVELLLSLTITAVIGTALVGVIGAVISGMDSRRDNRSHIVRGYASQSRLTAYITLSRAFLHADDDFIALWFNDSRQSDTVHASEVRWLTYSPATQAITAHFVRFPDNWTTVDRLLEDREYPSDADWRSVLLTYRSAGLVQSLVLVDGISAMRVTTDETRPINSRHIILRLTLSSEGGQMTTQVAGTLREHSPPVR